MSRNVSKTVSGIFYCCLRSYLDRAHWFFRGAFSDQEVHQTFLVHWWTKRGVKRRHYLWQSGDAEHQPKRGCCRGTNCSRCCAAPTCEKDVAGLPTLQRCCRSTKTAEMLQVATNAVETMQKHQLCRDVAGVPTLQRRCRGTNSAEMLQVYQLCRDVAGVPTLQRCCRSTDKQRHELFITQRRNGSKI